MAATATPPPSPFGPITTGERIQALDILRGFALFGILVVNMDLFRYTVYSFFLPELSPWQGPVDNAVKWLIKLFAEGKFNSLFSFLFAIGLTIQISRASSRGGSFLGMYARRLGVLLAIGLLHGFGIWLGDVLVFYAVLGFVLLLFRRRSDRALFAAIAFFLLLPAGLEALRLAVPEPAGAALDFQAIHKAALQAYSQGTWWEVAGIRAQELSFFYLSPFALTFSCDLMVTLLIGLYVGRRGVFQDIPAHLPWVRRVMWTGLCLGLLFNTGATIANEFARPAQASWANVISTACHSLGRPTLFAFYASGLLLLTQREGWSRRLAPLGVVGRMPLTNYLMQSVVCTLIFNGYGFGFFGKVGPAAALALCFLIYLAQIPISQWWMSEFRFGPMEWLWRSLSYGRVQPMRGVASLSPGP